MKELCNAIQKVFDPERVFLYWFYFMLIASALINSFFIDKHFACDGVYYFYDILKNKDFVHHDWARQYSLYITQWPAVLAIHLGIKDIYILNKLFALGVFSVYFFSFLLNVYALRGQNKSIMIWPIFSMVALNLSTDYHLTGEFPVVMLLSWPILFLLLRKNLLWHDKFILFFLLVIFSRVYQSAMLISLVFILLLLFQQYYLKRKRPFIEMLILIILFMAIIFIAVYTTIHTGSEENRNNFISGLSLMIKNIPAIVSIIFIVLFFMNLFFNEKLFHLVTILPVLFYIMLIIVEQHGTPIYISFASRSMSATIFPLFLILALIFQYRKLQVSKSTSPLLTLFIVVMIVGNIKYSRDWRDYREKFKMTLSQKDGFIPIEETELMNPLCYWDWTAMYLSLAWSEGCVKTIVVNVSSRRDFPESPYAKLLLKDYLRYDSLFLSVDSTALTCDKK